MTSRDVLVDDRLPVVTKRRSSRACIGNPTGYHYFMCAAAWPCVCTLNFSETHGLPALSVTQTRSCWACIGNPKLEQESIEGTHAQETPAYQRRPTTLHEGQGSNPPIRALHMQLEKIPHTHHATPRATSAPALSALASKTLNGSSTHSNGTGPSNCLQDPQVSRDAALAPGYDVN